MTTQARRGPGDYRSESDSVPLLTLYLVLMLAIPSPMVVTVLGQVGGPATLVSVGCFLWWVWTHVQRSSPTLPGDHLVRNVALLFLGMVMLTYAHSAILPLPFEERSPADGFLIRAAGFVGLVCLTADGVPTMSRLWTVAERITTGVGLLSMLALVQTITDEIFVDRLSIPGLSAAEGLEMAERGMLTRPSGTSTHPIELAAVLAMGMPFVLAVAGHATRHVGWYRAMALFVPLELLIAGSRTAMVCGVIAFLIMLWAWRPLVRLLALGIGVVMLAGIFVAVPGMVGTLRGMFQGASGDSSVLSRTNSFGIAGEFWERHLWLGRGMGTFLPRYWIFDDQYLGILVGAGLIGALVTIALFLTGICSSARVALVLQGSTDRPLAVAAVAASTAGAVSLALFDGFGFSQASGMLFVSIGICGALRRITAAETQRPPGDVVTAGIPVGQVSEDPPPMPADDASARGAPA